MAEIKKHFKLTVNLKFDIDNTIVKDFNSLNVVLTVKNKPKKEFKQMKKLGKLLDKMKKSGWNITDIDYSILNKE